MERDYQGVVTIAMLVLGTVLLIFGTGYQIGKRQIAIPTARQSVMQGDVPIGKPVMVYWLADDGVLYGQSAIKTDYAGVLSFSTKARSTAYRRIDEWDYWTVIDPVMGGVEP